MDWAYKHTHSILPLPQCILSVRQWLSGIWYPFTFMNQKWNFQGRLTQQFGRCYTQMFS